MIFKAGVLLALFCGVTAVCANALKTPAWELVATAENGEIYSIDPASITETTVDGMQVKTANITVDKFKGYPETDHLWTQMAVFCEKPAYRNILAFASKEGSDALFSMPTKPAGQWSTSKDGTPLSAVMKRVCR